MGDYNVWTLLYVRTYGVVCNGNVTIAVTVNLFNSELICIHFEGSWYSTKYYNIKSMKQSTRQKLTDLISFFSLIVPTGVEREFWQISAEQHLRHRLWGGRVVVQSNITYCIVWTTMTFCLWTLRDTVASLSAASSAWRRLIGWRESSSQGGENTSSFTRFYPSMPYNKVHSSVQTQLLSTSVQTCKEKIQWDPPNLVLLAEFISCQAGVTCARLASKIIYRPNFFSAICWSKVEGREKGPGLNLKGGQSDHF